VNGGSVPASERGLETTLGLATARASVVLSGGPLLTVSSLKAGGREWLRAGEELPERYRVHGRRAGITLLHPWANRLGADRFPVAGRIVDVSGAAGRLSRDANGLAIHGLLAPRPWRLIRVADAVAVASLTWLEEAAFPFPHQVCVRFSLHDGLADGDGPGDDGTVNGDVAATLVIQTRVSALSEAEVPVALGWHPYFRRHPGAAIDLPELLRLAGDASGLPTAAATATAAERIDLTDPNLDFGVGDLAAGSEMSVQEDGGATTVRFDAGYRYGQIFAPADAAVVSLEPMVAATDALRHPGAVPLATRGRPVHAAFSVALRTGAGAQRAAARR
jgi:aldose 1-epimerase